MAPAELALAALVQAAEAASEEAPPDLAWMKEAATVFFFVVFLVILARLLLAGREKYEARAQIPLHEDRVVEPRD